MIISKLKINGLIILLYCRLAVLEKLNETIISSEAMHSRCSQFNIKLSCKGKVKMIGKNSELFIAKIKIDILPQNVKFLLRATAKLYFSDLYFASTHPLTSDAPKTIGEALFGTSNFAGLYSYKILTSSFPKVVDIYIDSKRGRRKVSPGDIEKIKELLIKSLKRLDEKGIIEIIEIA